MSVSIGWDAHDIMRYEFNKMWHWHALNYVNREALGLLRSVSHDVGIIFDMQKSYDIPVGATQALWEMIEELPPNVTHIVILSTDDITTSTFQMVKRFDHVLGSWFTVVSNYDTGIELLRQYAKTTISIPLLPAPRAQDSHNLSAR